MTIAKTTPRPVRPSKAAGTQFQLRDQCAEPDENRWKVSCVENPGTLISGDVRNFLPA